MFDEFIQVHFETERQFFRNQPTTASVNETMKPSVRNSSLYRPQTDDVIDDVTGDVTDHVTCLDRCQGS